MKLKISNSMHVPIKKLKEHLGVTFPHEKLNIVSVWGDFGVGKTTFAFQTAINHAKLGQKVVCLFTKPNIPFERMNSLIQGDRRNIINNILMIHCTDFDELYELSFNLEFLILNNLRDKNPVLSLIVVDSITDLYRLKINREKKEKNFLFNYQLNQIMASLSYLNDAYGIEILLVNELSRINENNKTIESQAGGKVMEYWVWYSIKLSRTDIMNERVFILKDKQNKNSFSFISTLTERGFE